MMFAAHTHRSLAIALVAGLLAVGCGGMEQDGFLDPDDPYYQEDAERMAASGTSVIKVATFNSPHRLLPHAADFQALAQMGVAIICAQENTDNDPKQNHPKGWRWYRPTAAQSNAIYWNPTKVTLKDKGHVRVSSPDFPSVRHLVWVHFRTPQGPMRVASIHLPAFKTSKPKNAREFRKQEPKLASWLGGGIWRVMAGDFNSQLPNKTWCPNLSREGNPSRQLASGPHGANIDYVVPNRAGNWKPVGTSMYRPRRSDHNAVVVKLARK